jgi:ketosteroid isomerase-like protein
MHRLKLASAAILLITASAPDLRARETPTATSAPKPELAVIRAEVNAANIRWVDATRRQDFALLSEMMAPDYVVTYHDGKRADLPTWLERFRKIRMLDCGATIVNLRIRGPDIAEATVTAYWDAVLANGKPFRETYIARDTWTRRGGRWLVVGRDVVEMRLLD